MKIGDIVQVTSDKSGVNPLYVGCSGQVHNIHVDHGIVCITLPDGETKLAFLPSELTICNKGIKNA